MIFCIIIRYKISFTTYDMGTPSWSFSLDSSSKLTANLALMPASWAYCSNLKRVNIALPCLEMEVAIYCWSQNVFLNSSILACSTSTPFVKETQRVRVWSNSYHFISLMQLFNFLRNALDPSWCCAQIDKLRCELGHTISIFYIKSANAPMKQRQISQMFDIRAFICDDSTAFFHSFWLKGHVC